MDIMDMVEVYIEWNRGFFYGDRDEASIDYITIAINWKCKRLLET